MPARLFTAPDAPDARRDERLAAATSISATVNARSATGIPSLRAHVRITSRVTPGRIGSESGGVTIAPSETRKTDDRVPFEHAAVVEREEDLVEAALHALGVREPRHEVVERLERREAARPVERLGDDPERDRVADVVAASALGTSRRRTRPPSRKTEMRSEKSARTERTHELRDVRRDRRPRRGPAPNPSARHPPSSRRRCAARNRARPSSTGSVSNSPSPCETSAPRASTVIRPSGMTSPSRRQAFIRRSTSIRSASNSPCTFTSDSRHSASGSDRIVTPPPPWSQARPRFEPHRADQDVRDRRGRRSPNQPTDPV